MAYSSIDCFSGCGGLSEGLRQAGFKVLAGVELRPDAREAHALNHPKARQYGDIQQIDAASILADLKLKPGDLDLLAGCPPCQGFSSIRTRRTASCVEDPRNELIFDFIRLAEGLLPKTILMENVPPLLKDERIVEAKRRLENAGYKWIVADERNAAYFGVPQRRRRMILMASRVGPISLPEGSASGPVTVRKAIGSLGAPSESSRWLHRIHMKHSEVVMDRIRRIPKDGGSRSALNDDQLSCHQSCNGFKDVYGRMKWDDVAPTITRSCINPSKGRFLHPEQDRAITLYEAMRLQSFPPNYKFPRHLTMTQIASMIGEALPPRFAAAQARHIREHLATHTRKRRPKT